MLDQWLPSAGALIGQLLAGTLSVATVTALAKWIYSQHHRIVSVRASYLAQLESLAGTVSREIEYAKSNSHPYSWFPILPYFESEVSPLSIAGILSNDEVREITSTFISYKETLIYLWQYGTPSRESDVIGRAIGINLSDPNLKGYYLSDLELLHESVRSSVAALKRADKSWRGMLGWLLMVIVVAAVLFLVGVVFGHASSSAARA